MAHNSPHLRALAIHPMSRSWRDCVVESIDHTSVAVTFCEPGAQTVVVPVDHVYLTPSNLVGQGARIAHDAAGMRPVPSRFLVAAPWGLLNHWHRECLA
jgi:hypothetical protein